jgi:hypothetical protein
LTVLSVKGDLACLFQLNHGRSFRKSGRVQKVGQPHAKQPVLIVDGAIDDVEDGLTVFRLISIQAALISALRERKTRGKGLRQLRQNL